MIDGLEHVMPLMAELENDQLRTLMAHAAGLHAQRTTEADTALALHRVADGLVTLGDKVTMREAATGVALKHGLTLDELRRPTHARQIVWPRQEAMFCIREIRREDGEARFSLPQIARFLGLKDHTTILHGIRRHKARISEQGEGAA